MRSRISIRGCVRPSIRRSVGRSHTSWNHAKVPCLTKTTISTSENASYGRVSGLVHWSLRAIKFMLIHFLICIQMKWQVAVSPGVRPVLKMMTNVARRHSMTWWHSTSSSLQQTMKTYRTVTPMIIKLDDLFSRRHCIHKPIAELRLRASLVERMVTACVK